MNDPIDRQAAIDALRYAQHRFTVADEAGGMGTVKWSEDVIYFAAAERVLTELPPAQPEHDENDLDFVQTHKRIPVQLVVSSDCISRQAAIDALMEIMDRPKHADFLYTNEICKTLNELPSAPDIIRCKDCKHWKDSDGVYRRGIGAESKCPVNIRAVYEGNFYCADAERKEGEADEAD